jgi:Protein of unknown function (DUF4232)
MNGRVLAAAAAAAAAAVVAVAVVPASAGPLTPTCKASQLRPHFHGQQGAAGTLADLWSVTNVGATCHTMGFLGALNFGADGRPLPTTVHWIGAKNTVVLGHNKSAHWRFYFPNPGILNCVPEAAANMIVTPPDNTSPILTGRGERSCHGVFNASALEFGVM